MNNAQQILAYSILTVTAIAAIAVYTRTISAAGATLGDRKFKYKFNRARLPLCAYLIVALAIISFVYCLVIAQEVSTAVVCATIMTFFGGLGIILRVGYTS